AEQVMIPVDHLLLPETDALPAIVVVRTPNGNTHFVVAWRRHAGLMQLMDPARGRRWSTCRRFLDDVYVHRMPVPAEAWREWAGSETSMKVFDRRMNDLGIRNRAIIETARTDTGWQKLGALDAALRLVDSLVASGGVRRGRQAAGLLERLLPKPEMIPAEY